MSRDEGLGAAGQAQPGRARGEVGGRAATAWREDDVVAALGVEEEAPVVDVGDDAREGGALGLFVQ